MAPATLDSAIARPASEDDGRRFVAALRRCERRLDLRVRVATASVGFGVGAVAAGAGWLGDVAFLQGRLGRVACVVIAAALGAFCRRAPRGLALARLLDHQPRGARPPDAGRVPDDAILAAADLAARAEKGGDATEGDLRPLVWRRGLARLEACEGTREEAATGAAKRRALLSVALAALVLTPGARQEVPTTNAKAQEIEREIAALAHRADEVDDRAAAALARALLAAIGPPQSDVATPAPWPLAAEAQRLWQEHQAIMAALAVLQKRDAHATGTASAGETGAGPRAAAALLSRGAGKRAADDATRGVATTPAAGAPTAPAPDDPAAAPGAEVSVASSAEEGRASEPTRQLARLRRDLDEATRACARDPQACQRAQARTRDDEAALRQEAGDEQVRRSLADAARRAAGISPSRSPDRRARPPSPRPVEANVPKPGTENGPGRLAPPSPAPPSSTASRGAAVAPSHQSKGATATERGSARRDGEMARVDEQNEAVDQAGALRAGGRGRRAGDALPPEAISAERASGEPGRLTPLPPATSTAGATRASAIEGAAAHGTAASDYARVYTAYRDAATRAMSDTHVGAEHRALVERYFQTIRPRRAPP